MFCSNVYQLISGVFVNSIKSTVLAEVSLTDENKLKNF